MILVEDSVSEVRSVAKRLAESCLKLCPLGVVQDRDEDLARRVTIGQSPNAMRGDVRPRKRFSRNRPKCMFKGPSSHTRRVSDRHVAIIATELLCSCVRNELIAGWKREIRVGRWFIRPCVVWG